MASRQAIQFLESVYSRVDKQVRDIVTSMLPNVDVAAQDDGSVIGNDRRILNFQGAGVTVTDEDARRRYNIFIPGSPVATGSQIVQSSDSGIKTRSLWSGSSNTSPPSGWAGVGFDDSTWTTPATVSSGGVGGANIWPTSTPASSTEEALFRETFTIPTGTTVTSASLAVTQDDDLVGAYINNTLIGSHAGAGTTTFTVNPSTLATGSNVVAFDVRNAEGAAGPNCVWFRETVSVASGSNDMAWQQRTYNAAGCTEDSYYWTPGSMIFTVTTTPTVVNIWKQFDNAAPASIRYNMVTNFVGAPAFTLHFKLEGGLSSSSFTAVLFEGDVNVPSRPVEAVYCYDNVPATGGGGGGAGDAFVNYKLTLNTSSNGTDTRYIPWSTITTKGDLVAGTGSATGTRLGVGTNGDVLTADSTQMTGLKWAPGGGGGGGMTNPMTTQDDIIVGGSSGAPARLAKGSSSQVLTVDSGTGHLAWNTPSAGALSYATTQLSANVSMANANQFYDGPSVSLTAGTWLIIASLTFGWVGNTQITMKVWDGTTVGASIQTYNLNSHAALTAHCIAVLAGSATWKASAATANANTATINAQAPNNAAGNTASTISAVKIA